MSIQFGITMGALADPLEEQLNNQGLTLGDNAQRLEEDATAITRCRIRGLITEGESEKARKRLMKYIKQAVKPLAAQDKNTTHETDD